MDKGKKLKILIVSVLILVALGATAFFVFYQQESSIEETSIALNTEENETNNRSIEECVVREAVKYENTRSDKDVSLNESDFDPVVITEALTSYIESRSADFTYGYLSESDAADYKATKNVLDICSVEYKREVPSIDENQAKCVNDEILQLEGQTESEYDELRATLDTIAVIEDYADSFKSGSLNEDAKTRYTGYKDILNKCGIQYE